MSEKIEFIEDDNGLPSCGMDPQKIHILYNKQELYTEDVFSQELDKMKIIMKAKQELNSREDIIFYMTSEDLMKVKTSKSPVYIRLRPDQLSSKITENIKMRNESPKTSRADKSSDKSTEKQSLSQPIISVNIDKSLTPPSEFRKPYKNNTISKHSSPIKKVILEHKRVIMNHSMWNIAYEPKETKYSIFEIDQKGVDLICRGMTDSEVNSLNVSNLKGIPIHYNFGNQPIDAYVYTSDINNIKSPIYFLLTTVDYTCDIKSFVGIIEDLINVAKIKYNENR